MIFKKKQDKLEVEIENLMDNLVLVDPTSDDYAIIADNLKRLLDIKAQKQGKIRGLSKDTLARLAVIIFEIGLITNYEKFDVITTKALGIIPKVKL